jgi:hypothetical protein
LTDNYYIEYQPVNLLSIAQIFESGQSAQSNKRYQKDDKRGAVSGRKSRGKVEATKSSQKRLKKGMLFY